MTPETALEQVTEHAQAARQIREQHKAAMSRLRQSIREADGTPGVSRNRIAEAAEPALTRANVYRTLRAHDLASDTRAALRGHPIHVLRLGDRVEVELGGQVEDAPEVARMNAASAASNALGEAGLVLVADATDPWTELADPVNRVKVIRQEP